MSDARDCTRADLSVADINGHPFDKITGMKIEIGGGVMLDLERFMTTRCLIQSNSGGGKSWALRRLLEQTHGHVQQIIIDPEDEFYTLREKHDYILIRHDDGDAIPDIRSAELLATKLLELGVSAIISLYELKPRDRREFVKRFLGALVNARKDLWHKALVVIDEAHEYCPEQGKGRKDDSSGCADAVIELMSKGRKRGFCGILATQRISKLNKDAAAECNNKFVGRCTIDLDRKRAAEELGMTDRASILALRQMKPGDFFAFGPAISNDVIKLRFGSVHTTHPEAGAAPTPVAPPKHKITAALQKLGDIPKEAEQERVTVAALQQRVRELEAELSQVGESWKTDSQLQERAKSMEQLAADRLSENRTLANSHNHRGVQMRRVADTMRALAGDLIECAERDEQLSSIGATETTSRQPAPRPPIFPKAPLVQKLPPADGSFQPTRKQQEILDAIAWFASIGNAQPKTVQVGAVALIDSTGGHFSNVVGPLTSNGLVERGDSRIWLTDAGRAVAKRPERVATMREYHDVLRQRIRKMKSAGGKTIAILDVIISRGGGEVTNSELGVEAQIDHTGGHFSNMIGPLSTAGLITRSAGIVRPTEVLFPPGIR